MAGRQRIPPTSCRPSGLQYLLSDFTMMASINEMSINFMAEKRMGVGGCLYAGRAHPET